MQPIDQEKEIRDIKRRLDLAESKLSQQSGQFEFISGQLRDIQLYIHARSADLDERHDQVDKRFNGIDKRFDGSDARAASIEGKVDALPRVIAELIGRPG